jgi:hypothetical protein
MLRKNDCPGDHTYTPIMVPSMELKFEENPHKLKILIPEVDHEHVKTKQLLVLGVGVR